MTINVDADLALRSLSRFASKQPQALSRAMNRSASKAETSALRKVREVWNIRAKDLKQSVRRVKSTVSKPSYTFTFTSASIPLLFFTKTKDGRSQNEVGVKYKVKKRGGFKTKKSAFINKSKSRNRNYVLIRDSADRYPITPLTVVSPTYMFLKEKADDIYIQAFYDHFRGRYASELEHLLK